MLSQGATIAIAVGLTMLSAVSSGLTMGLMILDVVTLRVLIDTAEKQPSNLAARRDAQRAKRVYRLRKDGNLLLVTLIIANVSVNSAFSIIAADLTSGVVGAAISIITITLCGEIVPQAVCSRYSLLIGYYLSPIVCCIEIVLYVVVKPIAMTLDFFLGEDLGTTYNREQLKALVGHHEKELKLLNEEEVRILFGGLDVASKTVGPAMTSIENVFGIDISSNLDFDTAAKMITSGYSRVPIFDKSTPQCIVGLIYTKDIALVDPSLQLPVRSILSMFGRPVYGVDIDTPLLSVLSEFKKGQSHFAVVRSIVDDGVHDRYYRHTGVITLEDIIEEILQDEILDEYEPQMPPVVAKGDQTVEAPPPEKKRRCELLRLLLRKKDVKHKPRPSVELSLGSQAMPPSSQGASPSRSEGERANRFLSTPSDEPGPVLLSQPAPVFTRLLSTTFPSQELAAFTGFTRQPKDTETKRQGVEFLIKTKPSSTDQVESLLLPSTVPPVTELHLVTDSPVQPVLVDTVQVGTGVEVEPRKTPRREKPRKLSLESGDRAMLGRLRLFDKHRRLEQLSVNEATAVGCFLAATEAAFRFPYIDQTILQRLLHLCPVQEHGDVSQLLFTRLQPSDRMVLILQGKVRVVSGEDQIEATFGAWQVLGAKALGPPTGIAALKAESRKGEAPTPDVLSDLDKHLNQWAASYVYKPDFTAHPLVSSHLLEATPPLRCLHMTRSVYLQGFRATILQRTQTGPSSSCSFPLVQ